MLIAGIFNLLVHLFDDFIRALLCPWLTGRKSGNLARDGGKVARRSDRESQVGRVVSLVPSWGQGHNFHNLYCMTY